MNTLTKYRKALTGFLVSWVISMSTLFFGLRFVAAPWIKNKVETKGSVLINGSVRVGDVRFALLPSLGVRLIDVDFKSETLKANGRVSELAAYSDTRLLSLVSGGALAHFRIKAIHPVIESQETAPLSFNPLPPGPRSIDLPLLRSPRAMGLTFDVTDGELTRLPFEPHQAPNTWRGFQFSVEVSDLNKYEATIHLASVITWKKNGIEIPFDLQIASSMVLRDTSILWPDIQGSVNGITSKGSLAYDLTGGPREIKLTGSVSEIGDLKIPPPFLPQSRGRWKGGCDYRLHLQSESAFNEWTGEGQMAVHHLHGESDFTWPGDHPLVSVNGLVGADFEMDYTLSESPRTSSAAAAAAPAPLSALSRLKVDQVHLRLDLSQAAVEKFGSLKKPKETPFIFEIAGAGTIDQIHVHDARLQFATLKAAGSGDWLVRDPNSAVDILGWKLKVEPTDLSGWDQYFPALAGSPVKGRFELETSFSGDLRRPEQMSLSVHPLVLQAVEGNIHFRSGDGEEAFSGPVRIDGQFDFENKGADLAIHKAALNLDLTQLDMMIKDAWSKKAGIPFKLAIAGAHDEGHQDPLAADQLAIPQMILTVHSSLISMACRLAQPKKPVFSLNMIANKLNLGELAEIFTPLSQTGLSGLADGHFTLQGVYDFERGIRASPLNFSGELKAEIPVLKIPTNWGTAITTPSARPTYLDWPLFKTANVDFQLLIAQLSIGQLKIKGLNAAARLRDGLLTATGSAEKLFSGRVRMEQLTSHLLAVHPGLQMRASVQDLNLLEATQAMPAPWLNSLSGSLTGTGEFSFPPLQTSSFREELNGHGHFEIKDFLLAGQSLDAWARTLLTPSAPAIADAAKASSIPHRTVLPSKLSSTTPTVTTDFELRQGTLRVHPFIWRSPDQSQISFDGDLGFDQSLALRGTAALTKVDGECKGGRRDSSARCAFAMKLGGPVGHPSAARD